MTGIFTQQLQEFARKTDARVNLVVKKIILDIGTRLVLRSPVGDAKYWTVPAPPGYVGGRFRANWQFGIGNPDLHTDESIDPTGAASIGRINTKVPDEPIGQIHYITNSLPYAIRLEEGWSRRQAPNGMVRLTTLEFDPIVREAAAQLT